MPYIKAKNEGVNFLTQEDREAFSIEVISEDIFRVSGQYHDWVKRVNGRRLSMVEETQLLGLGE